MVSVTAVVGKDTVVLPLLNGMRHVDRLAEVFGRRHILGGQCALATGLGKSGVIQQLGPRQELSFGELDGQLSIRCKNIALALGVPLV
jgi:2-dehydropantoate 2-reductase